jgi:adenine phosphoribosyltransferase
MDLKSHIRAIADFPQPGILFRDITPLLGNAEAFGSVVDTLVERYRGRNVAKVLGIESRGFLFAAPLALRLGCGFVPLRKPGKLPAASYRQEYRLEYGTATLEMHQDGVAPGERVVILDDLLATGGTAAAAAALAERAGAVVEELAFVIELEALNGRAALGGRPCLSLVRYAAEEA